VSINNLSAALSRNKPTQLASIMRRVDSTAQASKSVTKENDVVLQRNEVVKRSVQGNAQSSTQNRTQNNAQNNAQIEVQNNTQGLQSQADSQVEQNKQKAATTDDEVLNGELLTNSLKQVANSSKQLSSLQIRKLEFLASEESGKVVVKVIDKESDDVIRQIPSEEFIRVAQKISDLSQELDSAQGLLFESKV
jgi:flagellar protein FlaG